MAGFDIDGARTVFGIPASTRPLMVIAVGSLADYSTVDEQIAERDRLPRQRLPLEQVAFDSTFAHMVYNDSTITVPSRQIGPLLDSTWYYWRVNAKNSATRSTASS